MELSDIKVGSIYWLMLDGNFRDIKIKVISDEGDGTFKIRLPNGATQSVFPDELGPL